MQANIKKVDQVDQLRFVQIQTLNRTDLKVQPGGTAINNGGLVIAEVSESGSVGTLRASNRSDDFLILTDADILSGAKQTRIVNKSVLLAPHTHTILDVSCVERSRWRKVSETFGHSHYFADQELRSTKAAFFARKEKGDIPKRSLQHEVWGNVDFSMARHEYKSATENYNELAEHLEKKKQENSELPVLAENCNGLMIFRGGQLLSLDVFGNEELYAYYFQGLINAAKRSVHSTKAAPGPAPDQYEQMALELLDSLDKLERKMDGNYSGAGQSFNLVGTAFFGAELKYLEDTIHLSAFQSGV